MNRRGFLIAAPLLLALGACSNVWGVDYEGTTAEVSRDWRVTEVAVTVPETASVSEEDVFTPVADIVWRGEAEGDRRFQVARIVREAATAATADMTGSTPVRLEVDVTRFHSVSQVARAYLTRSGVNDIRFDIRVVDPASGTVLASETGVRAPSPALVGPAAVEAARAGGSERARIVDHLTGVFSGWFGTGPDARNRFFRLGS